MVETGVYMRRFALLVIVLLFVFCPVFASADYSFRVDKNIVDVTPQKDGSALIDYRITFFCNSGGKPIDIVDIGLPNKSYNPSDFSAWLNGTKQSNIRQSEYISTGIEIPLSRNIGPGKQGTLRVKGKVDSMVWQDSKDDNYASVEFAPTYFDSGLTTGTTALTIRLHFPNGVTANETKYHKIKPSEMGAKGGHMVFTWFYPETSPSGTKKVGIGFPKSYVDTVYSVTWGDRILGCFGALSGCFFTILIPWVFPFGLFATIFVFSWRRKKRRMLKYLPPELSVEGVGIKRGLTAPEAALIQEMTLDRVLTMMLFGLLKKGAVQVRGQKPLKLKIMGIAEGVKLRKYEKDFMACIKKDSGFSKKRASAFIIKFIKDTNKKLKGFSRKETVAYYKQIADKAWQMVEEAKTPEKVGEAFEQKSQWLLFEKELDERMKRAPHQQSVPLPHWWTFDSLGQSLPSGGGATMSLPDLANSMTNSISGFADGLVTNISDFTSSITGKTNPPPISKSYSGGGGGGGCACACACAGCACACAGGGR